MTALKVEDGLEHEFTEYDEEQGFYLCHHGCGNWLRIFDNGTAERGGPDFGEPDEVEPPQRCPVLTARRLN